MGMLPVDSNQVLENLEASDNDRLDSCISCSGEAGPSLPVVPIEDRKIPRSEDLDLFAPSTLEVFVFCALSEPGPRRCDRFGIGLKKAAGDPLPAL